MNAQLHASGSYRFIPALAAYSAGVVADFDCELVWVVLGRPLPLAAGIQRAIEFADSDDAGKSSVCSFALRSPATLDMDQFAAFNASYLEILSEVGLYSGGVNSISRTNVVPTVGGPEEAVVYGFAYSRAARIQPPRRSFITAGAAELQGQALDDKAILRPGDVSTDGLAAKARLVVDELEARLRILGVEWSDATAVDVYTRHEMLFLTELLHQRLGAAFVHGVRWFFSSPPVAGLDFEMDLRGVAHELVII